MARKGIHAITMFVINQMWRGILELYQVLSVFYMSTTHSNPWSIPIITWLSQFGSVTTNTLLVKRKLTFQSKAIAFRVAMSLRHQGDKYHCHPTPGRESESDSFFLGGGGWQSELIELHQTGVICLATTSSVMWCLKTELISHTVRFQLKWRVLHNYDISGWYVFQWDHLLDEGLAFVQPGVPSCFDDVTDLSYTNLKCEAADVNVGIPIV